MPPIEIAPTVTQPSGHHRSEVLRSILRVHRTGRFDPTTRLDATGFWRATSTPDGPGTLHISFAGGRVDARAWGPGADRLLALVPSYLGDLDTVPDLVPHHRAVAEAVASQRWHRIGACRNLFHTMAPVVIAQRVTSGEARRSWASLCRLLGERAPGLPELRLPPDPATLRSRPYWWFHRLGIERKRADALRTLAGAADHLARLDELGDADEARRVLSHLPGIGIWTLGASLGPALGDPDAFAVGDYWLKHGICHALAGEVRGTDERMVELLEPYRGQRGRVVGLLTADGWHAERRGPGIATLPIASL